MRVSIRLFRDEILAYNTDQRSPIRLLFEMDLCREIVQIFPPSIDH